MRYNEIVDPNCDTQAETDVEDLLEEVEKQPRNIEGHDGPFALNLTPKLKAMPGRTRQLNRR